MKGIVGHWRNDDAIRIEDGLIEVNGNKKKVITVGHLFALK